MSTHNIGFYEDLTKIIFELSSNTHPISSAVFDRVILDANFLCCLLIHVLDCRKQNSSKCTKNFMRLENTIPCINCSRHKEHS